MPSPFPGRVLAATLLALAGAAAAQDCPQATEVLPKQLVGLWRAEFEGGGGATLLLEPHRDFVLSLSGEVNRNGERAKVAADLEDGEFTLEESADGVKITAAWQGEVVEGSCGREIRGSWQSDTDPPVRRTFTLRRLANP